MPSSQATLVKNRIGDPRLAAQHLGYKFEIDLDEGLRRLIEGDQPISKRLKLEEKQLELNNFQAC